MVAASYGNEIVRRLVSLEETEVGEWWTDALKQGGWDLDRMAETKKRAVRSWETHNFVLGRLATDIQNKASKGGGLDRGRISYPPLSGDSPLAWSR